jgi:LmbE family N-acetylglucosaminyl deacetylase
MLSLSVPGLLLFALSTSSSEIAHGIDRLGSVGTVLYVAAHPDDENTRLLTWLVHEKRVRAAYLSLTRGEGGQNLIGSEQGAMLGAIRTHELLGARSIDGAEQWFASVRDFGYSKSPEETLAIWGKDETLRDVVRVIRRVQPDVIITRFSPDARDTHGHHTASAILALEAFKAAADPAVFPEPGIKPWQAKRIVWNKGVWGPAKPEEVAGFVQVDVSGFEPLLGTAYGEIAAKSRSMHKSQGFGASPQRGKTPEYFKVLAGEPMTQSPFDGVDTAWTRLKGGEPVQTAQKRARAAFMHEHPSASLGALFDVLSAIEAMPDNPFKTRKAEDTRELIAACAGLYLSATIDDAVVIPGGEAKGKISAISQANVQLQSARLTAGSETRELKITKDISQLTEVEWALTLPSTLPLSTPYWLLLAPGKGRWQQQETIGLPKDAAPIRMEAVFSVGGKTLRLSRDVVFSFTDPVAGESHKPIEVLPPVVVEMREPLVVFPTGASKEIHINVRATKGAVSGSLQPVSDFPCEPASLPFNLDAGAVQTLSFKVKPPKAAAEAKLALATTIGGVTSPAFSVQQVTYAHIPKLTHVETASAKLTRFDLKIWGPRVGYLPGAGDEVAAALTQAGYNVTQLDERAIKDASLTAYDAIVIGVRAFNTSPSLLGLLPRLHAYVAAGGTLVTQYNTNSRLAPLKASLGPLPMSIAQDRVTDETAPVVRTLPNDVIWSKPNTLVETDFSGWVQERGLYFASTWDPAYRAPIEMNDPGEPAKKGALVIAQHGKGRFVYTGLAFFRQLPAGVPGAFKLFANLLSNAK